MTNNEDPIEPEDAPESSDLYDECNAFRQTFLSLMPPERARIFREFGDTIFEYGLEMSRYSPHPEFLNNRFYLYAVVVDLDYIAEFLRENIESDEGAESNDEARLASVVATLRPQLLKIITVLQEALARTDES